MHQARALVRELVRASGSRRGQRTERRWQAALAGLALTYRWARESFARAYARGDDAAFGAWRTAVKYHALHLRLLAERWPEQLSGRQEVVQRLAELLAPDQALSALSPEVGPVGSPEMRSLVEQRHQALRALARPLGRRLFADAPSVFRKRLQACWLEARERPQRSRAAA